jgi:Putative prokaryotic signal transducing protein
VRRVHSARTVAAAHIVKAILDSEGISSEVRGEHLAGALGEAPLDVDTLPSVWVSDSDAVRADELVREALSGQGPVSEGWTCPNCGEELEGQFTECWQCGASRPGTGPATPTDGH